MSVSRLKLIISLTVIGLLLLVINFTIPTGIKYMDAYENSNEVIGEYQFYNINAFYGAGNTTYKRYDARGNVAEANVPFAAMMNSQYSTEGWFVDKVFIDNFRIDIFNDIIAFFLLIYVCISMKKHNVKMFSLALITSSTSMIIKILLSALPFIFNGLLLCNLALSVGIAYVIAKIFTVLFLLKGYAGLIQDTCCREERWWLDTLWYVTAVLMVLLLLLKWLDLNILGIIFTVIASAIIILIGFLLKRTIDFIIRNCNYQSE